MKELHLNLDGVHEGGLKKHSQQVRETHAIVL